MTGLVQSGLETWVQKVNAQDSHWAENGASQEWQRAGYLVKATGNRCMQLALAQQAPAGSVTMVRWPQRHKMVEKRGLVGRSARGAGRHWGSWTLWCLARNALAKPRNVLALSARSRTARSLCSSKRALLASCSAVWVFFLGMVGGVYKIAFCAGCQLSAIKWFFNN